MANKPHQVLIKELNEQGISVYRIAKDTGISQPTVSRIKNGKVVHILASTSDAIRKYHKKHFGK